MSVICTDGHLVKKPSDVVIGSHDTDGNTHDDSLKTNNDFEEENGSRVTKSLRSWRTIARLQKLFTG